MTLLLPYSLLLLATLTQQQSVDYSQNGKNWNGTCASGTRQSPINIDTSKTIQNSYMKYQINYNPIEDSTLLVKDNGNKVVLNITDYTRSVQNENFTLTIWNERGESSKFHLDYIQWKYKSEHTINNRQYAAELQLYHNQYATNKQVVLSILFDEELTMLSGVRQKTCFVESFKFSDYKNRVNSLEVPMREYLQFIPQDFYFYYGSITEPQCSETATWIIFKNPQPITQSQLQSLKSIIKSPTGNNRNIQKLGTQRVVYLSGAQLGYPFKASHGEFFGIRIYNMIIAFVKKYKNKNMNSRLRQTQNNHPSAYNGFSNNNHSMNKNANLPPGRKQKPSIHSQNTNKNKNWKALNMRVPAGATIADLQDMDRHGHLIKPEIGNDNYRGRDALYGFDDKFTDIELEKFKEAFIFFDRDGDGTMKAEDVGLAMRAMGALVSNSEVKTLLKKYDPDGTGTIDLNDFIACLAEVINKDDNPGEIKNAFSVFDKEDNGMLPVDEMRHVLTRIGDPLSQEEITNFLNILDVHGDGYVRFNNLMDLLIPQTNKDLYAKTVGGEGVERSQMSYGAPQIGRPGGLTNDYNNTMPYQQQQQNLYR